MAEKDEYTGITLGDRPDEGDYNQPEYAQNDLVLDNEDYMEFAHEERGYAQNKKAHRGHAYQTVKNRDLGEFKIPHAHYDPARGKARVDYGDHLDIIQSNQSKLRYSKVKYPFFDNVIHFEITKPIIPLLTSDKRHDGLMNRRNQKYEGYQGVRDNVAVLRNALFTMKFPDGEYNDDDPKDKEALRQIREMADKLGKEMKWHSRWLWLVNTVTFNWSANRDSAQRFGKFGDPHYGAKEMYDYLYNQQERMSWNPISWLRGKATRHDWELPHPEDSPFSAQDIHEVIVEQYQDQQLGIDHAGPKLANLAVETERVAAELKSSHFENVRRMNAADREEAVEHAENILRRLKDICAGRSDRAHEGIDHTSLDLERAHCLQAMAEQYQLLYADMLERDPSLEQDSTFDRARIAIGKLGHLTMLNAQMAADKEERPYMKAVYASLPDEYKKVRGDTEAALIRDVEVALKELEHRNGIRPTVPLNAQAAAQQVTQNLHHTMSGAHIAAAPEHLHEMANYVNEINHRRQQGAREVDMTSRAQARQGHEARIISTADQDVANQYRA